MICVNDRNYAPAQAPVVGICLDGTSAEYLEKAARVMPNLQRIAANGCRGLVQSVIPSFTNPNNLSIVTGTWPRIHGICGNFYYDPARNKEVLMNSPDDLRAPTILSAFSHAGSAVAVVTTKDKLRLLLGKKLKGICFSVERAQEASVQENGIAGIAELLGRPRPDIYDPEASIYCLEAGVKLLKRGRIDLMYLTTTDYVQHKYKPGSEEANHFYRRVDEMIGQLDALGAIVGITADHGMNDKTQADGSPKVQFIETILKEAGIAEARTILPITDPYVVHHGALGSFATVYVDAKNRHRTAEILRRVPGVELVLNKNEAASRYHLPEDRIGDLTVLSDRDTVLGRARDWHDLASVASGLRSHGGLHEGVVPLIINRPVKPEYGARLRSGNDHNFDLYDYLFNGLANA